MMKFRSRPAEADQPEPPNTTIGVGSSLRGTLMVSGTLRIDGEFEGDILNCERLEVGENGLMPADASPDARNLQARKADRPPSQLPASMWPPKRSN